MDHQIDLFISGGQVVTCKGPAPKIREALRDIGVIENGAVACSHGNIVWVGKADEAPLEVRRARAKDRVHAKGKVVMPGFIDSHTHLVFAGSREDEYAMKLRGIPYLEILERGGGILNTVEKTREASGHSLFQRGFDWLSKMLSNGTTTVEIKSGYGLSFDDEMRLLGIIGELREMHDIEVVSTLLGAHVWPKDKTHEEYMKELEHMIEHASRYKLAEFCDVFCEKGAFSLGESARILECAKQHGMKAKIHAGEMNDLRGGELAAELGVTSFDHGEELSVDQLDMLAKRNIPVVLMPGVNFHLRTKSANARNMIETGIPVALATDFNPGSSPVLSMQFIMQLACRMYGMSYEEAINAATINAAYAIERADRIGSLEVGKQADILILDIPTYQQLPYWIGSDCVETVIKKGRIVRWS